MCNLVPRVFSLSDMAAAGEKKKPQPRPQGLLESEKTLGTRLVHVRPRRCAHYDCDALWIQNFQDGGEGREISQVICFIFQ